MRKPYEKPALYAESFELVEHISACESDLAYSTQHDSTSCAVVLSEGGVIFTAAITGCANGQVYDPSTDPDGSILSALLTQSKCYTTYNTGAMYGS